MTEEQIKAEMRLSALEFLVCRVWAAFNVAGGATNQDDERRGREFLSGASRQIFPGLDPAMSDHATAEWNAALERLLTMQTALAEQMRESLSGRR